MNILNKLKNNLLAIVVITGVVACASRPAVQSFPPSANPAEEITNLESELQNATEKNVNILSPQHFIDAKEALASAKRYYGKGKDSELTLKKVARGNAYLSSAISAADLARENTEDVMAAREDALKANVLGFFDRQFKEVDEEFMTVTRDIEKNKLNKISKMRPNLQAKYLDLELKAIKESNLKESRKVIELAKDEGAKKYAPRTLLIAEESYLDTANYITANRHNTQGISLRAKETSDAANNLLKINRIAKGTYKVSPEEVALTIENEKKRVAMKQGQLDIVEDKLQMTQSALEREKEAKASLVKTQKELEAIKMRDEKYEEARKSFTRDEAEVYKQGDALLIRLKGMEFPISQATIQSKNYPLLSKVKKVMEKFGTDAAVTIEGHTDSIGGKKINEKLSGQRALAVKEYLESNNGGIERNIEAIGYGDEKPIAGNKTAGGRAQNRRVDIIITPEKIKL